MADLGKQFLDTDGLKALWLKAKSILPFRGSSGTPGTGGWVKMIDLTCKQQMNKPLVFHLLCRGYTTSTVEVTFTTQTSGTTPDVFSFIHSIKSYDGTHGANTNVGYTYEDIDGVRHFYFWKQKNEGYGSINIHVDCQYDWTTSIAFPNEQSNSEPAGIVYATEVWETVPTKKAVAASAKQVGYDKFGQVVLGNALTKSDVGLGNVDNTSDANKPISTATQTALDGKVAKAGDTMTGQLIIAAPTSAGIAIQNGTSSQDASITMTRTDTGVGLMAGVGGGGVNHGLYSNKNKNWIIRADTSGNVYVNDTKATSTVHIGNSDVGSTTKPVYIDDGVIKAGSTYAGGTAVTLNGTSASGSTASFYAPTGAGTNHRFLRSTGSGVTWVIPAADYTFNGAIWTASGDTHTLWAFRLKGITNSSYNNVLLSFDTYFWNNQKSSSDLIWIGWSNNGNQNLVATAGRFRIAGNDNTGTPLEYYLVKNTADTAAACTVDLYIRPASAGNSYGSFYVNVLNSGNRDLDDIIEKKETYSVDLPEGAIKIQYSGTIGSADTLSTARELAVGLGNTSTTTTFDGSADVTNIKVSGTLPIANGGTGATTVNGAQYNLLGSMAQATSDFGDNSLVACRLVSPSAVNGAMVYRTGTNVWSWIKGKLTSDTGVNISGNAATATSAGKLTNARELAVGLSNTSTTTMFDGSSNVTNIKVSGTLPVANGGTGSNTAAGARTNLSVYSKSEVDSLMSGRIEVVTALPATGQSGIIYYVGPTGSGSDKYDEYIWTGSAFIKVGEHSLDLSNYVNTVTTSGSGSVVTGVSKSGSTVTVTKGNLSLDDLSDWATETDVTISNVTYHTMWPVAPTSSNQVYGISINGGRLFRIYNNKGTYSVQAYDKDSDTTYTPQKLGSGYGTCTTAEATAAKVVTLTDYVLVTNGIVAVKFSYPLCASATLNINGKGAKPVYVGGAAVTATNCKSVQGGDIGYFIYDGTAYHFLGTDRAGKSSITGLSVSGKTVTYTRADGETGTFDTQDTTYAFADSYNASTNKGATVATVTNAINALDVTDISGFGAGKTLATLAETNGKISATFQNISITKSQVSDFSHTHGNIQNGGTLQTTDITIANGDKLVVTDSSDSSKVARASISFDGSTTTKALTQKGTWETFNNYSHPAGSAPSKTGVPTGNVSPGFGGTFKVNQITTDSTSHVSAVTERTITIPNATATTSAAGLMSAADKTKLNGIATGAEVNVQSDWNDTDSASDAFIKNKPYFSKYIDATGVKFKVCTVIKYTGSGTGSGGIEVFYRRGAGAVHGELMHKVTYELYLERIGDVSSNTNTIKFYYIENPDNSSYIDIYADSGSYCRFMAAPMANMPKDRVDFTGFGTAVSSIPEGATEITPVWVANSAASSGTAPVKVDAYGTLTAVPMDSTPTASSTNLMTSGAIKTALGSYLPLSGGTMTGKINAWASQYTDDGTTGAIDMKNSNIVGLNSLYTADASDGASEGIHFFRETGKYDTLWMAGGHMYFVPNRAVGTSTSAADSRKVAILPASITTNQMVVTDGTAGDVKGVDAYTGRAVIAAVGLADGRRNRGNATGDGWGKIASITKSSGIASTNISAVWSIVCNTSETNSVYILRINIRGTSGSLPSTQLCKLYGTDDFDSTRFGIKLVIRGTSAGSVTAEIWACTKKNYTGIAISELAGGEMEMGNTRKWTYYTVSGGGEAAPEADTTNEIQVVDPVIDTYSWNHFYNGIKEVTFDSSVTVATFLSNAQTTNSFANKVFGAGLTDTALLTINAIGRLNISGNTNIQTELENLGSYPMFHVVATRQAGYVEFEGSGKKVRYHFGTSGALTNKYYEFVKLNNSVSATPSFYAPTSGGTANYVLIGNGTTSAPTWAEKAPKAVVADYVNMLHTNEVNFKNVPTSGNKERVWFNYRNGDTDAADSTNLVTDYYFGNRNQATTGVTLHAANFDGLAAKATADADGNSIKGNYLKTTSGTKSLSFGSSTIIGTVNGANVQLSLPANPNTDTKQNITLATTTKAFITGVSTTPTSTAQALTGLADTGVYLTTTAGELNATQYKVNEHCTMKYNSTKSSLDFTFS